jgi:hypothetical protein
MESCNKNLRALHAPRDEYYTRYEDIDSYLSLHQGRFLNKIVYCPCDTQESNFYKYFRNNFKCLKLKKLICTTIPSDGIFSHGESDKITITLNKDGNLSKRTSKIYNPLGFLDCANEFIECDLVVTNPPFSMSSDIFKIIFNIKKDFFIISSSFFIQKEENFKRIINQDKLFIDLEIRKFINANDGESNVASLGNIFWFNSFESRLKSDKRKTFFTKDIQKLNLYEINGKWYATKKKTDTIGISTCHIRHIYNLIKHFGTKNLSIIRDIKDELNGKDYFKQIGVRYGK